MKILVLLSLWAMTLDLSAQDAPPFLTEGKSWNYLHHHLESDGFHEDPFSLVVKGDTIVGDVSYKRIYRLADGDINRLSCMLREEGRKVYKLDPDNSEEYLLFDFGRNDVGVVNCWESQRVAGGGYFNWMISKIDSVQVNDILFRRFCCLLQYSETPLLYIETSDRVKIDYWVERIGSIYGGITRFSLEIPIKPPGEYSTFVSCYENGGCIFTADDFTKPAFSSGIQYVNIKPINCGCGDYYDIQGHRHDNMNETGIYIYEGKKYFSGKPN